MYYNINDKKEYNRPKNTNNVSWPADTKNYKIETLIEHGYYPIEIVSEPMQPWQKKSGQTYKIKNDKVEKTILYTDDSLDDYKSQRVKELSNYLAPKYPAEYAQINASNGIYDEEKSALIISEVKKWRDYFYLWKGNIEACETYEEVLAIDYITEEDKLIQEEMFI